VRCDTHGGKLLADERRICVDNLSKQKLSSNGDNIAPHAVIAAF
jgi:hypothetical protein